MNGRPRPVGTQTPLADLRLGARVLRHDRTGFFSFGPGDRQPSTACPLLKKVPYIAKVTEPVEIKFPWGVLSSNRCASADATLLEVRQQGQLHSRRATVSPLRNVITTTLCLIPCSPLVPILLGCKRPREWDLQRFDSPRTGRQ